MVAKNLCDGLRRAEDDPPPDFNHAPARTMFVYLSIRERSVQHTARFFARSPSPAFVRCWFRGAVIGDQCCDIGGQFVRGKKWWPTISFGLKCSQKTQSPLLRCGRERDGSRHAAGKVKRRLARPRHRQPPVNRRVEDVSVFFDEGP